MKTALEGEGGLPRELAPSIGGSSRELLLGAPTPAWGSPGAPRSVPAPAPRTAPMSGVASGPSVQAELLPRISVMSTLLKGERMGGGAFWPAAGQHYFTLKIKKCLTFSPTIPSRRVCPKTVHVGTETRVRCLQYQNPKKFRYASESW